MSHLLYSLVLELKARREAALSATQGYRAYALLLQALEWRDPEYARGLHDLPGAKPLTVSPLLPGSAGPGRRAGEAHPVAPGEVYRLRVTALDEEVFARLLDALLHAPADRELRLEGAAFGLHRVLTTPEQSEWAGFSSFEALLAGARPERRLRLEFRSPTAFRSGGQRNFVFPAPSLVFGSLLARWNQLAPAPLPAGLREVVESRLLVARYRLETRMLDFGRYREVGFVGECEYEVGEGVGSEAAAQLAALAGFAWYGGVGAKTTMGMGQARGRAAIARTARGGGTVGRSAQGSADGHARASPVEPGGASARSGEVLSQPTESSTGD